MTPSCSTGSAAPARAEPPDASPRTGLGIRTQTVLSAVQVAGPTTPSAGVMPFWVWNVVTAAAVPAP